MWQALVGSLTGPECRRALDRRWVLVVRFLSTLPAAIIVLCVVWFWWITTRFDASYSPAPAISGGLVILEGFLITAALVLSPAMLAGALSGERVRGVLAMLLASDVSSREIIQARLTGRLAVVAAFVIAGAPGLVLLGSLNGWGAAQLLTALALPLAVALGGGGLAVAASSLARRGRDALLAVFLADLAALIAPVFAGEWLPPEISQWLEPLNPFVGIGALVESPHMLTPALRTIAIWSCLGLAGSLWAAWRLRPNYLRDANGQPAARSKRGRTRVPAVSDRPLVWKELYIEQLRSPQRIARWLGITVVGVLLIASIGLAGAWFVATFVQPNDRLASWATAEMSTWVGMSASPLSWLLQWALGLRAAVCIASERERATWDALLTSPLEGREIVAAKIYGSLYALRGFIAAIFLAWSLAALCGAIGPVEYATLVAGTLAIGVFMVTIGVWASLSCASATVAMTFTLVGWLAGICVLAAAAAIVSLVLMLMGTLVYLALGSINAAFAQPFSSMRFGAWFEIVYTVVRLALYLLSAFLVAIYCRQNFDRLAGRLAPGLFRAVRAAPIRAVLAEVRPCGD